ncbi:FAD-dependent oxidoreductase [uncultured Ferrovibrio sp.]|jgi:fumarate reductase flavoprotein subunit|uniref:FAD-dependent oxidoreductase n=1 Tax=uncultured Ferrovibrio sp. TaxID=1576913 RepID=UPI002619E160|nr:FAD-dependent oxidoreductase [uncultured Ferrovibrio sp.]
MSKVLPAAGVEFALSVPVLVIGGGACGLVAALAAHDAGAEVLVLERDPSPSGSTAMSSGMIPAAGTSLQKARGVDDTPAIMAADIQAKAHGENDQAMVDAVCAASGPTVDWLVQQHKVPLKLVEGFLYPGHSKPRMHAPASRSGADLIAGLLAAANAAGIDIVCDATVTTLFADPDGRVRGVALSRPDGTTEQIGCDALVLACSGFGGNADLVKRHIPEIAGAQYYGHTGNRGDALLWGEALGAAVKHLGAYQGHGSLAMPHAVLITWALMMEGGFQVNANGERFSCEHDGYSEQAMRVIAQPGGFAWNIYDERLHKLGLDFEDYRDAMNGGAVKSADSIEALAALCGMPPKALAATLKETQALAAGQGQDRFGRDFSKKPALAPPFYAVKVTGALFHTQGGLSVDTEARVLRPDGQPLPNLLAGGGAACGLSGRGRDGYLSGNGLLMATVLGAKAGRSAAAIAAGRS